MRVVLCDLQKGGKDFHILKYDFSLKAIIFYGGLSGSYDLLVPS